MNSVRLGLIGLGNMGRAHKANILVGKVKGLELKAVCDLPAALEGVEPELATFTDAGEMIASGQLDAIHIATPHPFHCEIGCQALEAGLHVMMEKPLAVHKAECERLIDAYQDRSKIFAAMFNQRTDPLYRKLKDLIDSGELGQIRRVQWNVTDWFRSQEYYASGGWRATWKGEGGGVLLNQCPHNLDLFQWMFGMPQEVHGFCNFGRYHQIEVEDDVSAYFRYDDGCNALFVTSTGEAPGVNRLEVIGEQGLVTVEKSAIHFRRNRVPMSQFSDETLSSFGQPEVWETTVPVSGEAGQHVEILRNFTNAILHGETLISPAVEGIHSVELANAILYSAWKNETLQLPLDSADYARELQERIDQSTFEKRAPRQTGTASADDFAKSF